jgi:hypothetical protein
MLPLLNYSIIGSSLIDSGLLQEETWIKVILELWRVWDYAVYDIIHIVISFYRHRSWWRSMKPNKIDHGKSSRFVLALSVCSRFVLAQSVSMAWRSSGHKRWRSQGIIRESRHDHKENTCPPCWSACIGHVHQGRENKARQLLPKTIPGLKKNCDCCCLNTRFVYKYFRDFSYRNCKY